MVVGFLTLTLFGYPVFHHKRIRALLTYAEVLSSINGKGLERATGRWLAFAESGAAFRDDDHPYASDLELFGQGSLFQWINSAQTALGREYLAKVLKQRPMESLEIVARQEAVTELARKLAWRQRFESEGLLVRAKLEPMTTLLQWAKESHQHYPQPLTKLGVRLLPAVTILMVTLYELRPAFPWQVPTLLIMVQALLLLVRGKNTVVFGPWFTGLRQVLKPIQWLKHKAKPWEIRVVYQP